MSLVQWCYRSRIANAHAHDSSLERDRLTQASRPRTRGAPNTNQGAEGKEFLCAAVT